MCASRSEYTGRGLYSANFGAQIWNSPADLICAITGLVHLKVLVWHGERLQKSFLNPFPKHSLEFMGIQS